MKCHTRVPRFRLPAPLRGSTPRQFLILSLDFWYLCRSAQDDTEVYRFVRYNPTVVKVTYYLLLIAYCLLLVALLHRNCITHATTSLRVILSGAAAPHNGERYNRQMPRSRTPKGRRQAGSRHSCREYKKFRQKKKTPERAFSFL